ncbi:MAG: hypothetical protein ACYSUV_04175 [Planctomycetota bacterium]
MSLDQVIRAVDDSEFQCDLFAEPGGAQGTDKGAGQDGPEANDP